MRIKQGEKCAYAAALKDLGSTMKHEFDLFISYASKDEDDFCVAGARVRPIESFKSALERHVVTEGGRRRRFRVCTDIEDFSPNPDETTISDTIKKHLDASRALLVICSRHAGVSPYVAKEIELFSASTNGQRVFAAMLDAAPDETFPGTFRAGTLGANLGCRAGMTMGEWHRQLLEESHKVVALVLGTSRKNIFDRFQADLRRQRLRLGAFVLVPFMTLAMAFKVWRSLENESQEARTIANGIGSERGRLPPPELALFWELAAADDSVRFESLRDMLATAELSAKFNRRPDLIVQAAVGISPLRHRVIDDLLLRNLDGSAALPTQVARMHIGARLQAEDERFNRWAVGVLKQALDQSTEEAERVDLAMSAAYLAPQLSGDAAAEASAALLPIAAQRADPDSAPYVRALRQLGKRLDAMQIATIRRQIVALLAQHRKQDPRALVALACRLPTPLDEGQTRELLEELSKRWKADEETGDAILELVRHLPPPMRWELLERLPALAVAGENGWSRIRLTPSFEIVSRVCAAEDEGRTMDALLSELQKAQYSDDVIFVTSGLKEVAGSQTLSRRLEVANQIADFILGEFERTGNPTGYNDFKGGFSKRNPVSVLPSWLDAIASLRCELDSQRATALFAKAKRADCNGDCRKRIATPPLVAALDVMSPQLAKESIRELIQPTASDSRTEDESSEFVLRILGDIAQALTLRVKQNGWGPWSVEGQMLLEQIIVTALGHASSPIGHYEARAGGVGIAKNLAADESRAMRDRLFENLLKGEPAYYGTATVAEIAAALPETFSVEQVSELTRAWNFNDFKEAWRFESLKSLPGKLPADIGREWLSRFVRQCDDSSDTFYRGLLVASRLLPPRVNAPDARRILLEAMTQTEWTSSDFAGIPAEQHRRKRVGQVLLARALASTAEPLPGADAAEAISRLIERWLEPASSWERSSPEMLQHAIYALVDSASTVERGPVVVALLAVLRNTTEPDLQRFIAKAVERAVGEADESTGQELFNLLTLTAASEGNPVVQVALARGLTGVPGKISTVSLAQFVKSPICAGATRDAAFNIVARLGGLAQYPRLPDVAAWFEKEGVNLRTPVALPATLSR